MLKYFTDASILIEAMIDHNILSISKLYSTIKIESLGSMLNIEPRKAESKTGKMISEGLIEGSINQITGFIYFKCKFQFHICTISSSIIQY